VRLQLLDTFRVPDALVRPSLQAFVNEVCCFFIPAVRDGVLFYLDLADEYLVADVLPGAPLVGSLAHHALVGDDAHCEVVGGQAMVLSAHNFGRHVAGRARRLTRVVWRQNPRYSKVSQAQIAFIIEHKVFRLDVPMDNKLGVDGLKGVDEACDEEARDFHVEFATARDVVPQVATQQQVHHQVQIHLVLERVVHVHDEGALDHRQQLQLVHHTRHTFLSYDTGLGHLFHCKFFIFIFFRLHTPDFAKATSSHSINLLEVRFAHLSRTLFVFRCFEIAVSHLIWSLCVSTFLSLLRTSLCHTAFTS